MNCTCAQAAVSTKHMKKIGSSVAYKTIGTFLYPPPPVQVTVATKPWPAPRPFPLHDIASLILVPYAAVPHVLPCSQMTSDAFGCCYSLLPQLLQHAPPTTSYLPYLPWLCLHIPNPLLPCSIATGSRQVAPCLPPPKPRCLLANRRGPSKSALLWGVCLGPGLSSSVARTPESPGLTAPSPHPGSATPPKSTARAP